MRYDIKPSFQEALPTDSCSFSEGKQQRRSLIDRAVKWKFLFKIVIARGAKVKVEIATSVVVVRCTR